MLKSVLISIAWLMTVGLAGITYNRGKIDGMFLLTIVVALALCFVTYHHKQRNEEDWLG